MEAFSQPPQSLDQKLKHLIQDALKYPVNSTERQQCLHGIYTLVMKSGKLWRDYNPYCGDAVNDMWYECFTHLEDYDPSLQQVTTWLNDSLRRALRRYKDRQQRDLKRHRTRVKGEDGQEAPIVEFLTSRPDAAAAQEKILYPVLKWVEADADGKLQKRIFGQRPDINVQSVILKRIPPQSKDWNTICTEFRLSEEEAAALPRWYHRYCKSALREFGTQAGLL
jgi:hypothetical protein